ncbi:hypothetical protein [Paraburkholderia sp. C35]|uniref:hypothetical protein n=1 Tax=Paraburkholderia sp. C35 TaxID=2126993 RepID=UPI000D69B189|nr:hypothetical protein [Paraburkholderia sp. C35]
MRFIKPAVTAATLLFALAAMPAHAQSLEDQAPAQGSNEAVTSFVQAPVAQDPIVTPRLSFQPTGGHDWHLWIDANVHAYHFNRGEARANNYNENNWGGGFELTNDVLGVMGGYYYNSLRRGSWYLLGRYTPLQFDLTSKDRVNVGVLAGVLSGYVKTAYEKGYTVTQEPNSTGTGTMPVLTPAMLPNGTKPRGFMPAAGLLVSYEHDHQWGVNLIFVPPVRSEGVSPFMGVELRYSPAKFIF